MDEVFDEAEEAEEELDRLWPEMLLFRFALAAVVAEVAAPSQSKGLANGLTALKVELAADAVSGGLSMVAAAAAAAE